MKKSLVNNYLKALNTLVNDNCISFSITENFTDKCHIVAYYNNQVLHNFTLFNDSSTVSYDNLVNDYLAIVANKQGDKQLFSLRYDSMGYCSLAVTDSDNYELYEASHKRISRKLAGALYSYADNMNESDFISCHTDKYATTYNYSKTLMFLL